MRKECVGLSLPKMILFDYGHTLIYEPGFDEVGGYEIILSHAVKNVNHVSAAEMAGIAHKIFADIGKNARDHGIEIHDHMFLRLLFEYLELEFTRSLDDLDTMFWDKAAPGQPMPNVEQLLVYMKERGIRSGVISNIGFSEVVVSDRLRKLLPDNKFEFVMASSEYVYRKPNKILFEVALKKAHLKPEEVWFCGDFVKFDILGAASAGMFPVWYQSEYICPYRMEEEEAPEIDHLLIRNWKELIGILEDL